MIIAVDGPAASGKGTLAAKLAAYYRLAHLDTGLIYRAVGKKWLPFEGTHDAADKAIEIAQNLDAAAIRDDDLTSPHIGQAASKVAAIPQVRQALLQFQRDFARQPGGAVLDGRDIGTVICPDADVKLFVTASLETRARRRADQLLAKGADIRFDDVLNDIRARDERDSGRADAPLKPADNAHLLDTSEMDIETALRASIAIIDAVRTGKAGH